MAYHLALTLTISHAFWGEQSPPLHIDLHDPRAAAKAGLIAKPCPAGLEIAAETAVFDSPVDLVLDVQTKDRDLAVLTAGLAYSDSLPVVDLTDGTDDFDGRVVDLLESGITARHPADPLFRIKLLIPASGQRRIALHCDTVSALWAYHIIGAKNPAALQIMDAANDMAFDDLGDTPLPDGQTARVLRSHAPLPVLHRSAARFALEEQQDPPFDPITLIPSLPSAGNKLRQPQDAAAPHSLQSDIFVSLW